MTTVTLASGDCYWGLLDASARRLDQQARAFRFERVLPRPVEGLQCCSVGLADGRTLVVAVEAATLQEALAAAEGPVWRAVPAEAPAHLPEVDAERLARCNFLTGAFEPAARRRWRLGLIACLAFCFIAALVIGGIGWQRRLAVQEAAIAQIQAGRLDFLRQALGPSADGLPAELALTQSLRRLRASSGSSGPTSILPVLDGLWQQWPRGLRCQVESVTVAADRCVVRVALTDVDAVQRLTSALRSWSVQGRTWQAAPAGIDRRDEDVLAVITCTPGEAGS